MGDHRYIDKLTMPQSAIDAMAKAVPTDVVRAIVSDHYKRAAWTACRGKALLTSWSRNLGRRLIRPCHSPKVAPFVEGTK
jgi:hypothetical protein